MSEAATRNRVGYDDDFAAWADHQARLIRAGDFAALDLEHLAEEIEGLGVSERKELRSRLIVLLQHLIKWQYQSAFRSPSWSRTIRTQRENVEEVLEENPSLRRTLPDVLPRAYRNGCVEALKETGIDSMPETCPWTIEQVMSPDFLPD